MYREKLDTIFQNYQKSRSYFIENPDKLISLERFVTTKIVEMISENITSLTKDYNEASYLYPFWCNYPPEDRGRAPKGDQIPWIEVGEHAIGENITHMLFKYNNVREIGLPSGPDDRFLFSSDIIQECTGITDSAMVFMDIKSVGPRDNQPHMVISPYQASGDGIWNKRDESLINSPMKAVGQRAQHDFYPAMSPIYCLSDGTIAPTVYIFVKPIYRMNNQTDPNSTGQPLEQIKVICLPNGLLLSVNPEYCKQYPNLLFPGKDDKKKEMKDPKKTRCRVSFEILSKIDKWRVQTINTP